MVTHWPSRDRGPVQFDVSSNRLLENLQEQKHLVHEMSTWGRKSGCWRTVMQNYKLFIKIWLINNQFILVLSFFWFISAFITFLNFWGLVPGSVCGVGRIHHVSLCSLLLLIARTSFVLERSPDLVELEEKVLDLPPHSYLLHEGLKTKWRSGRVTCAGPSRSAPPPGWARTRSERSSAPAPGPSSPAPGRPAEQLPPPAPPAAAAPSPPEHTSRKAILNLCKFNPPPGESICAAVNICLCVDV